MAIDPDTGLVPVDVAGAYRANWHRLLDTADLAKAFQYLEDGQRKEVRSFELRAAALPVIFASATTALRIYPAASSAEVPEVGTVPIFTPLIRAIREKEEPIAFSDYYQLFPAEVAPSLALPPGANRAELRIAEITADRREQYRLDWAAQLGEARRAAFINASGAALRFNHFDSNEQTEPPEDHIGRLIALAADNGDQARFFLHLGWDAPQEATEFGYRSVLEMRDRTGNSLNFQNGAICPPWCVPPQAD